VGQGKDIFVFKDLMVIQLEDQLVIVNFDDEILSEIPLASDAKTCQFS